MSLPTLHRDAHELASRYAAAGTMGRVLLRAEMRAAIAHAEALEQRLRALLDARIAAKMATGEDNWDAFYDAAQAVHLLREALGEAA